MTTLLTRRQIEEKFQLSRSAIYQMMSQGRFPRPLRLGKKCVRWRLQDIEHYIESLPVSTGEASEAEGDPPKRKISRINGLQPSGGDFQKTWMRMTISEIKIQKSIL